MLVGFLVCKSHLAGFLFVWALQVSIHLLKQFLRYLIALQRAKDVLIHVFRILTTRTITCRCGFDTASGVSCWTAYVTFEIRRRCQPCHEDQHRHKSHRALLSISTVFPTT